MAVHDRKIPMFTNVEVSEVTSDGGKVTGVVARVDGEEQQMKDHERELWLKEQGYSLLRLPNDLVIASTELAVERIRAALRG